VEEEEEEELEEEAVVGAENEGEVIPENEGEVIGEDEGEIVGAENEGEVIGEDEGEIVGAENEGEIVGAENEGEIVVAENEEEEETNFPNFDAIYNTATIAPPPAPSASSYVPKTQDGGSNNEKKEDFAGEEADTQLPTADKADIIKGKRVTPIIRQILQAAEGMKFLMLTATPMYNEYREIIDLLNLLLMNDKRATIRESHIFLPNGNFQPGGRELLGRIAGSYVSFMRGENPLAFPIRLDPEIEESQKITEWPSRQPDLQKIDDDERKQVINLPYVACPVPGDNIRAFQELCSTIIERDKLTIPSTDKLIMAGNFVYPGSDTLEGSIGAIGFQTAFSRLTKPIRFQPRESVAEEWMLTDYEGSSPLNYHSPKATFLVDRIKTTKGVCFTYSRFVEAGALTLALILEANGYTCASRKSPLLATTNVIHPEGKQCALCPLHQNNHVNHDFEPAEFVPAQYILLTGDKDISPNNKAAIELAIHPNNFDGKMVKVILGSTIASEGIDLKYIRELFVFDSWYHLSKLEQVIGRGIRYKSHCALPPLQRNCTINLLVLTYPKEDNLETIDMYQYRNGFLKARLVGQVTRVLKEYALDCNLNKELILIQGLGTIPQIDGQGDERTVDVNDTKYTNICDWLETCDYKCKPDLKLDELEIDESTYDEYAAKWREHQIKKAFRHEFEQQPWRHFDDIQNKVLAGIPRVAKAVILRDIVGNRSFRIRVRNQEGYIIYKNGFYLFQPELLWDKYLPLSLRIMNFPVKRDSYEPSSIQIEEKPIVEEVVEEEELTQQTGFWKSIAKWSTTIAAGTADKETPKEVERILESRYLPLGSKTVNATKATFEMVGRLYTSIKGNAELRKKLADVLLEFVWDEYLSIQEIQNLTASNEESPEIQVASAENRTQLGNTKIFRYLDPKDKKIVYMCDGKPCQQSIIDGVKESDPIYKAIVTKETTGNIYGFNTAKSGKMVFKSNDAPAPGEKLSHGRLCYSVPNTPGHIEMLDTIGQMALQIPTIASDLDLLKAKTAGVQTPARLCTLADLSFRLLDKVGGKRYFYRPVSAIASKHEGK